MLNSFRPFSLLQESAPSCSLGHHRPAAAVFGILQRRRRGSMLGISQAQEEVKQMEDIVFRKPQLQLQLGASALRRPCVIRETNLPSGGALFWEAEWGSRCGVAQHFADMADQLPDL